MVNDQTSHMRLIHNSVWIGIIYTLPLLIWGLLQLSVASGSEAISNALQNNINIAILIQASIVSLYVPRLLGKAKPETAYFAILMLISIPWPLFALAWLAGAINASAICFSQGGLMAYALLLLTATRALTHLNLENTHKILALSGLQLATITLVILFPSEWVTGVGL